MYRCSSRRGAKRAAVAVAAAFLAIVGIALTTPAQAPGPKPSAESSYAALAAAAALVPRDSFDPQAVIEQVGREAEKLADWVRQNTAWVPYQGALKGATGVLMERVGNSADRSILLAELLRSAGYRVRLAHATLTDEQAQGLLARVQAVNPALLESNFEGHGDEDTYNRLTSHLPQLEAAVGAPPAAADAAAARLAAARDHWWVQRESQGQWLDVDVTADAATAGAPPPPPWSASAQTAPFEQNPGKIPLPDPQVHRLTVRVIVEAWKDGKLTEFPVINATVRPAELAGRVITLRHVPLHVPESATFANDDQRIKAALEEKEWVPILLIGDQHVAKASFNDAGEINERPVLTSTEKLAQQTGGLFGGLGGGLGGGGESKPTEPASVLTAEWVEYVIHSPGKPDRVIRREGFDLIGPAARAAGNVPRPTVTPDQRLRRALILGGQTETLALSSHWSNDLYLNQLLNAYVDQWNVARRMLQTTDPKAKRKLAQELNPPSPLPALAVARRVLSPVRGRSYLDTINVFNYRIHLVPAAAKPGQSNAAGKLALREQTDLVANETAAAGEAADAFLVRLRQGVADTAAEGVILGAGESGATDPGGNTLRLLAQAPQGTRLVALRPGQPAPESLEPDVKARVQANLAAGFAVVLPERPIPAGGASRFGWWRVHPATGETVGVMDDGFHADTAEYGEIEDTQIARTIVRDRRLNGGYWRTHPTRIARDMGYRSGDPRYKEVLDAIVNFQSALRDSGFYSNFFPAL